MPAESQDIDLDRDPIARSNHIAIPKNVFQRLSAGSALWEKACGSGYGEILTAVEMHDLVRLFQQRHLLEHKDGIVDQEYIDKSADRSYVVGQRIVIRSADVIRLAELVSKLAGGLRLLATEPKTLHPG